MSSTHYNEFYLLHSDLYSPNNHTLVMSVSLHAVVGIVCYSEDMWRKITDLFILVLLDLLHVVDI